MVAQKAGIMNPLYLLTGATGHLGSHVLADLLAAGRTVRVLVQPNDPERKRLPAGVDIVDGDVLDTASLEALFDLPAATDVYVIHMAAIITISSGYNDKVFRVNVEGTRNVVEKCLEKKVKRLVHVSSVHAIPELPHGQIIKEVDHFDPKDIVGFYGKTKSQASQLVLDAVRQHGLDAVIVHPAGIVGPGDYRRGFFTSLIWQASNGSIPAGVKGAYNFVDVRDVAAGIVSAMQKGRTGECYILANRRISLDELFHDIHLASGAKEVKGRVPFWLAKLAVPFFTVIARLQKKTPLFTLYALYTLRSNSLFSIDKAVAELDYRVRPFGESIRDTVAWMAREGWLTAAKRRHAYGKTSAAVNR